MILEFVGLLDTQTNDKSDLIWMHNLTDFILAGIQTAVLQTRGSQPLGRVPLVGLKLSSSGIKKVF
jgi:hypothetical protein